MSSFLDILNSLFSANSSGQAGAQAAPAPTAPARQANGALPTAPPQDYATFIKNQADAANAALHTKSWFQRGLLNSITGDDVDATKARVVAGAPAAYDAYQAGHTGVQAGQLDLGQNLAYINNWRLAHGQPPVDANNIPGTLNGSAPTAKPSLAPDTGASQANNGQPGNVGAIMSAANAMPMQGNSAPGTFGALTARPPASAVPQSDSPPVAAGMKALFFDGMSLQGSAEYRS